MSCDMAFRGEFAVQPPLRSGHLAYLWVFNRTRHMKRDPAITTSVNDPVVERNTPPEAQPGLPCNWTPSEDGAALVWDGHRKFVDWEPWLCYLIDHFLKPWGYTVNGSVEWRGEEWLDVGVLRVRDNEVSVGPDYSELHF